MSERFNPQDKPKGGPSIPNPEPGVVPARVARVIEIGEHETMWGVKDLVHIFYSLPTRVIDMPDSDFDGKQHMVRSKPLRLSGSEKAALMRDHINILKPDCQDLTELLTLPCFVQLDTNVVQRDGETREYVNITQVSRVPEGIEVGELDTTPFHFSFTDPDETVWSDYLWDGMRDKIKSALNYPGSAVEAMVLRLEADA